MPRRLFPVYRDRDESAASSNLAAYIADALAQSRFLIVICSPRAAVSRWVGEEVKAFKASGRADHVLCLIVDGEPNASDNPDSGLLECFPKAVRCGASAAGELTDERLEPLAADVRPGMDGKYNARLKLLAALLGVSYDELRQREKRRQLWRRLFVGSAAVASAALLFSVWQAGHLEALALEQSRNLRLAQLMTEKAGAAQERDDGGAALLYGAYSIVYNIRAGALGQAEAISPETRRQLDWLQSLNVSALPGPSLPEQQFAGGLAASRDGRLAAWGRSTGEVVLWDVAMARHLRTLSGHTGTVNAMAMSADGHRLVTAGSDGSVRLWRVDSGEQTVLLQPSTRPMQAVAFSADGRLIAAGGEAMGIRIWDAVSSAQIALIDQTENRINALAFGANTELVSTSQNRTLRVWDIATGRESRPAADYPEPPRTAAFNDDGTLLAVGLFDGTIRLWDVAQWREVATLRGHERSVETLAFSHDGQMLASGSGDWKVILWEIASRERITALAGHRRPLTGVAFVGDRDGLLTGSAEDHILRLWNVRPQLYSAATAAHDGAVRAVVFHPEGRIIASAGDDRQIRLWDAATLRPIGALPTKHTDAVRTLAFSPDGKILASAGRDGRIILWDWAARRVLGPPSVQPQHDNWIFGIAFAPNDAILASAGWDDLVKLWSVPDMQQIATRKGHEGPVGDVVFSPNGKILASSGNDHRIALWEATKWSEPEAAPLATLEGHTEVVRPIAFTPDSKLLASGSGDAHIKLWNVEQCLAARSCNPTADLLGHYAYMVWALALSPNGMLLASGSESHDRQTIRLWDLKRRELIAFLTGHRRFALSLSFSPDGTMLASGGTDGTVRLWRVGDFLGEPPRQSDAGTLLLPYLERGSYRLQDAEALMHHISDMTGLEMIGTDVVPAARSPAEPP